MKPEKQRVEIAKYLGFKPRVYDCELGGLTEVWLVDPKNPDARLSQLSTADRYIDNQGRMVMMGNLPDYCNDLNAMHEAETILSKEQCMDYLEWLNQLIGNYSECIYASASQRAEAFLKTLNLWK